MLFSLSDRFRKALVAGLTAGIFLLDVYAPLGMGIWLLYCLPLWLVSESADARPGHAYAFTGLCTLLVACGPFVSPPGSPVAIAVVNRSLGIAFLWVFCFLFLEKNKKEHHLWLKEERTRSVLSIITDVPWVTDNRGAFIQPQPKWETYTGQSWNQYRQFGWVEALHPDDRLRVQEEWQRACRNPGVYESRGRLWHAATQQYRHYVARAIPLHNPDGTLREWVGTCTDIEDVTKGAAEREVLLQQEQAARRQAEEASRLKDEFLAVLSHELRTPLNAILGWSQLLGEGRVPPQSVQAALAAIKRNAQNQAGLIEDLLDISRIVTGKLRLRVRPTDLAAVVTAAIETVRPAAESKGVRLQASVASPLPPISGDSQRLQQAFWNILSNAVKFTDRGGRIEVTVEPVPSHIQVTVSDTGKGIPAEFFPYLFDRFRQVDPSSTRQHGGLGLGLAIVREIVQIHGGTVTAESPGLGQGATFRVSLPIRLSQLAPETRMGKVAPLAQEKPGRPWHCPAVLRQCRVLLVDDEPDSLEVVAAVFRTCGSEVHTAASAAQAREHLRAWEAQLIVCDIGMPGEDGYTFIRKLREAERTGSERSSTAIALTAYARAEDRVRALSAGFQAHVAKPVEPMELVTVAASLVSAFGGMPPTSAGDDEPDFKSAAV